MFTYADKQTIRNIVQKVKNDGVSRTENELFVEVIEQWEKSKKTSPLETDQDDKGYKNAVTSVLEDYDL
jgi:hypothetical protein